MSILSTLKKGYLSIKTASGYMKLLPRTLSTLVTMNDGTTVEKKINQINTNLSNILNRLKNTIQTEDQKVGMTSNREGGNFWFMSPKGVRWEVDAYNETVRFFNYLTMTGFTIDQSGNMSVSGDIAVGSLNITLSKMLETLNAQTYCTCYSIKNVRNFKCTNILHMFLGKEYE